MASLYPVPHSKGATQPFAADSQGQGVGNAKQPDH